MNQDYKDYIANEVRKNQFKMIQNQPQAESLATLERPRMYGGKRVRDHPLPGHTAYSEEPGTLTVPGPTLLNRTYNTNFKQLEGAGFWGDVGHELKTGLSKGAKAVFHDVIVPVGTDMAKSFIKKKMTGEGRKPRGRPKKHYTHHDVRLYEPEEHHQRVDGAGFWKDFGHGFVQGIKGSTKVASKILPIATMLQPELAPLTGAVLATNKLINKGSGRGRPRAMGIPREYGFEGGNKFTDIIKKGAKFVAPYAKDIFHDVIVPAGTEMAKNYVRSKMGGRRKKCVGGASELYPPAVMKGGAKKTGGAKTARGALIKQIMNKHGCSLGEASKYIKQNNLI
jgi:hypothetical protein